MKQTDNLEAKPYVAAWSDKEAGYVVTGPTEDGTYAMGDVSANIHAEQLNAAYRAGQADRSLAPSGAVVAAAQAIIKRWDSPQWEWDKHGNTGNLIADLRNALVSSPSVEPTVDEQKTELQEAIKEIGKLQDQIKEMDNEIRGLNQVRNHYEG